MERKDLQDTITGCEVFETPLDLYLLAETGPHHRLPVTQYNAYLAASYQHPDDYKWVTGFIKLLSQ